MVPFTANCLPSASLPWQIKAGLYPLESVEDVCVWLLHCHWTPARPGLVKANLTSRAQFRTPKSNLSTRLDLGMDHIKAKLGLLSSPSQASMKL